MPGFKILAKVDVPPVLTGGTRELPAIWLREWNEIRSFCTLVGYEPATYALPEFKRHLAGGILWAVRREAAFKPGP
jgi:type 1 glutamine amidotransferase